jgi:YhcG PDDEXK nuclease domain
MHLYLNYASEHWMNPGENPPVGLILCAEKGAAEAHYYALDNLPNKVLAAEYQTVLPNEKLIAEELQRSRRELGFHADRNSTGNSNSYAVRFITAARYCSRRKFASSLMSLEVF